MESIKMTRLMLSVSSIDFYGGYSASPNQKYIVGYSRGEGSKNNGRCVLLEDQQVILNIKIPRPIKAVVVNSGTFAIKDAKFDKNGEMTSTLYIIDKSGTIITKKQYQKLITDITILDDMRLHCQIYDIEEYFQLS